MVLNHRGPSDPLADERTAATHWHRGQKLLEVVPGHGLAFGDEEAGLSHHCLQDVVQQFVTQPAGGANTSKCERERERERERGNVQCVSLQLTA